jgi:hypothetical protein
MDVGPPKEEVLVSLMEVSRSRTYVWIDAHIGTLLDRHSGRARAPGGTAWSWCLRPGQGGKVAMHAQATHAGHFAAQVLTEEAERRVAVCLAVAQRNPRRG